MFNPFKNLFKPLPLPPTKKRVLNELNISGRETHIVVFVSQDITSPDVNMAMCDCSAGWFVEHSTSPKAMDWRKNRSFPVIYKLKDKTDIDSIINIERYKTITKIDGNIIAICFGPMHPTEMAEYNRNYERLT